MRKLLYNKVMNTKDTDKSLETLNLQELEEVQGGSRTDIVACRCPVCKKFFKSIPALQAHIRQMH